MLEIRLSVACDHFEQIRNYFHAIFSSQHSILSEFGGKDHFVGGGSIGGDGWGI